MATTNPLVDRLVAAFGSAPAESDRLLGFLLAFGTFSVAVLTGLVAASLFFGQRRSPGAWPKFQLKRGGVVVALFAMAALPGLGVAFFWGWSVHLERLAIPGDALRVKAISREAGWRFVYPDGKFVDGILHIPTGQAIGLMLSADGDQVTSLAIPAMGVRREIAPQHYTLAWFMAPQAGDYTAFCVGPCSRAVVDSETPIKVHSPEAFQKEWTAGFGEAGNLPPPPEELGKLLFVKKTCNACHSTDGAKGVGPTFKGLWDKEESFEDGAQIKVDEAYIIESLKEPNKRIVKGFTPAMPVFSDLTDDEYKALVAFIKAQK